MIPASNNSLHFLCSQWHKPAGSATVQYSWTWKNESWTLKVLQFKCSLHSHDLCGHRWLRSQRNLFFSKKTLWLTRQQHYVFMNPLPGQPSFIITDRHWLLFQWRIDTVITTNSSALPFRKFFLVHFDWTTASRQERQTYLEVCVWTDVSKWRVERVRRWTSEEIFCIALLYNGPCYVWCLHGVHSNKQLLFIMHQQSRAQRQM